MTWICRGQLLSLWSNDRCVRIDRPVDLMSVVLIVVASVESPHVEIPSTRFKLSRQGNAAMLRKCLPYRTRHLLLIKPGMISFNMSRPVLDKLSIQCCETTNTAMMPEATKLSEPNNPPLQAPHVHQESKSTFVRLMSRIEYLLQHCASSCDLRISVSRNTISTEPMRVEWVQ